MFFRYMKNYQHFLGVPKICHLTHYFCCELHKMISVLFSFIGMWSFCKCVQRILSAKGCWRIPCFTWAEECILCCQCCWCARWYFWQTRALPFPGWIIELYKSHANDYYFLIWKVLISILWVLFCLLCGVICSRTLSHWKFSGLWFFN